MRERLEYWLVVAVARTLGWLPRWLARMVVRVLTASAYLGLSRLRRVGERNLELALREIPAADVAAIAQRVLADTAASTVR